MQHRVILATAADDGAGCKKWIPHTLGGGGRGGGACKSGTAQGRETVGLAPHGVTGSIGVQEKVLGFQPA
jgi:hypothetical protein